MHHDRNSKDERLIPGLTQWVKDPAWLWLSHSSDLTPGLGISICCRCDQWQKRGGEHKQSCKPSCLVKSRTYISVCEGVRLSSPISEQPLSLETELGPQDKSEWTNLTKIIFIFCSFPLQFTAPGSPDPLSLALLLLNNLSPFAKIIWATLTASQPGLGLRGNF